MIVIENHIDDFLYYLTHNRRMSPHTCRAYESDLTQFVVYLNTLGLKDISLIKSIHIRSWVMDLMKADVTARSVNRKLSTLRAWFKFLRNQQVITSDPMSKVISPKTPKHLVKDIPATDLRDMFDRFPWDEMSEGKRDKLLMLMLYTTGMRLSELIQLKWADVDFYRMSLRVLGKRNKVREIPLHDELMTLLKEFSGSSEGFIFYRDSSKMETPMYPMMVYRIVNHYLKLFSHASKTSPHVLRHSFATHMLNNGANLMAIKDLLGHASLSATQVYTKNSFEKLKKIHQLHPRR